MGAQPAMTVATGDALDICVGAFVDQLVSSGVRDACVCPGSRSTPLAMLLHAHPGIRVWMHLDERSASYFALGMAKASRRPVAMLATSGTAAANFAPAVAEARFGRVPLVVLTADRPAELRELGAPQTIDQSRMYGSHAKWFLEMPLPEPSAGAARHARMIAARAVVTASEAPSGPVHLNFPFREPLIPSLDGAGEWSADRGGEIIARGAPRRITPAELAPLATELRGLSDGIIVCGPQDDFSLVPTVVELASALGYPLLADPLSLVRCGPHDGALVVDAYDAFLRDPLTADHLRPGVVLRLGALPTSKPLSQFLQRYADVQQIIIDEAEWPDPVHTGTDVYHVNPVSFCQSLLLALGERRRETEWIGAWKSRSARARASIDARFSESQDLSEPAVFAELARLLPDQATLYVGNSMPVRDLDTFFPGGAPNVRFLANRGANGIDGVVSSALGASTACAGPLILVIGDLSFYHDMNGLLAAKRHDLNATIVLINNDGGGIFSFLPQAEQSEQFEELFGTPHGLDFRMACALYGISHELAQSRARFRAAVTRSTGSPGVQVIEVRTDRRSNVELHREIWRDVAEAMAG